MSGPGVMPGGSSGTSDIPPASRNSSRSVTPATRGSRTHRDLGLDGASQRSAIFSDLSLKHLDFHHIHSHVDIVGWRCAVLRSNRSVQNDEPGSRAAGVGVGADELVVEVHAESVGLLVYLHAIDVVTG